MTRAAITIEDVTKTYENGDREVRALDRISTNIEAGSITGIMGPNGAGKTTLIKCILGLVEPTEGTIRVNGHDIDESVRRVHQNVAAVLEGARNLYWRLSVVENMKFFSAVSANIPSEQGAYFEALLDRFGMSDKRDTPVRELSRGQKQKASILCALAREPEIVFLDEPTLGLDVQSSLDLSDELDRMSTEYGQTIIVTSHDMSTIQDICERVLILIDGRVEVSASVDELLDRFGVRTYEISVSDRLSATEQRKLADALGAHDFRQRRAGTRFECETDRDQFFATINHLREEGLYVERITAVEPDLEQIFVDVIERSEPGQPPQGEAPR